MREARRPGPTTATYVREVVDGQLSRRSDRVVTEEPLEIRLGWPGSPPTRVAVVMRTPGADFDLAAGYLLSEGVLDGTAPPLGVRYCLDPALAVEQQYNVVTVDLAEPPPQPPARRFTAVSSACGVCGVESLDAVWPPQRSPIPVSETVEASVLATLPEMLDSGQPTFAKTGAVHAAAVFGFDGERRVIREDVGRHNAVDKVLGARLLGRSSYDESSVLCVSGRIGFDIISKAVAGRIAVVVGVGGPSSLALALAERAGVTVCGFARGHRYVIYTRPERVEGP